jgi:hypothetical protein
VSTDTKDTSLWYRLLKWTVIKNQVLKIKKTELISCRCRRGAVAGAIMGDAVMEEPMALDETSKR